ncbi:DUF1036 domain-containing protein [Aestuariibius insulae]|uniref:DUF1036 domain-containing protein n=1 Tax=Aestuariibius insulae TaxID=2058287 RepID=UPI00345E8A88
MQILCGAKACLLLLTSVVADRAAAEFAVCNQTFDVVNVSIGRFETEDFVTRGWWTIGPNQCANVIREPLDARYIYVFAKDIFGKEILDGATPFCIADKRFVIRGREDCLVRGHLPARFIEVDTQRTERWTLFLAPASD